MLIKMPHFSEYSDDEPFLRADYLAFRCQLAYSETCEVENVRALCSAAVQGVSAASRSCSSVP